jgi:hypothetical protein
MSPMAVTYVEMQVANVADPDRTETLSFLVDSGATYSVVPSDVLDRLGIRPLSVQEFRLANGDKISRKKGTALFRYGERIGGADVVFGAEVGAARAADAPGKFRTCVLDKRGVTA